MGVLDGVNEYLILLLCEWMRKLPSETLRKHGWMKEDDFVALVESCKMVEAENQMLRLRIAKLQDAIAEKRIILDEADLSSWL